jgi:hypothetical protein
MPKSFLPKVEKFQYALKDEQSFMTSIEEYYMLPDNFWHPIIIDSNGFYSRWNPVLSSGSKSHCKYCSLILLG